MITGTEDFTMFPIIGLFIVAIFMLLLTLSAYSAFCIFFLPVSHPRNLALKHRFRKPINSR